MRKGSRTGRDGDKPTYDMPNMEAVRNESRRLNDPQADYPLARIARDAQLSGAASRRPR